MLLRARQVVAPRELERKKGYRKIQPGQSTDKTMTPPADAHISLLIDAYTTTHPRRETTAESLYDKETHPPPVPTPQQSTVKDKKYNIFTNECNVI